MYLRQLAKVLLFIAITTTAILSTTHHCAYANPVTEVSDLKAEISIESLEDSNKSQQNTSQNKSSSEQAENSSSEEDTSAFVHQDEDSPRNSINLNNDKYLKYDVEVLESRNIQKENLEVEERFRGPSIKMDTDTFIDEDIEVTSINHAIRIKENHILLSIILVIVALISIGLYAALVIWRSHLEQRYGMRELLVTDDDFSQYLSNSRNNIDVIVGDSNSNARHYTLGQA